MIWDLDTLLLVDPRLITASKGCSFVREEAFKHPEPIIGQEQPELLLNGKALAPHYICILFVENGIFRLWYRLCLEPIGSKSFEAGQRIAYAESTDGYHFKPVRVGDVEFNGNCDNNLLHFPVPDGMPLKLSGFLHDPLDAEYPFKCLYYRAGKPEEMEPGQLARHPWKRHSRNCSFIWGIGRSRDGFAWEQPRHAHTLVPFSLEHARLHRAMDGGFVIADQGAPNFGPCTDMGWQWENRNVSGWVTYDEETAYPIPGYCFQLPDHMTRTGALYQWPSMEHMQWVQPHIGLVVARKGPTMIGLNGYLHNATAVETFAQTAEVGLCVSDTGVVFREVWPFSPFVPRSPRGHWDHGLICQNTICETGTKTFFHYLATDTGNMAGDTMRIGVAWVDRDRYGYAMIAGHRHMTPEPMRAELTLRTTTLPDAASLHLNADSLAHGRRILVELADTTGVAIAGFGFGDCMPVTENGLRIPLRWKNADARNLAGRDVAIRLRMESDSCGLVRFDSPRVYAVMLR